MGGFAWPFSGRTRGIVRGRVPMVREYRWMYRTARPAIDMSTMADRSCIFYDIGNYPSRDHDTRKYHLSFGSACRVPPPPATRFSAVSPLPQFVILDFFRVYRRRNHNGNEKHRVYIVSLNERTTRTVGFKKTLASRCCYYIIISLYFS